MKIFKLSEIEQINVIPLFDDVVVIPTETVYGLAARIDNEDACKNIYKIKNRPSDNPIIFHISSLNMLNRLIEGQISKEYQILIEKFWPGPFTLLFKANETVLPMLKNKANYITVRMPKNQMLRNLIERLDCPLVAPSANTSGQPSPTTVEHVINDLGEKVKYYIDDGPCEFGLESTVFGIIDGENILLRPGAVTKEQIEEALQKEIKVMNKINKQENPISPGQKYKHYSPNVPVYLFKGKNWATDMKNLYEQHRNKRIGLLKRAGVNYPIESAISFDMGTTLHEFSQRLFAGLRELENKCDVIYVLEVELHDEGLAIMDRMEKASINYTS